MLAGGSETLGYAAEALWLELLALMELCGRRCATPGDQRALAALIDRLPEAIKTSAVTKARALLRRTMRP